MSIRRSASLLVCSWILAAVAGCERPGTPIAHMAASAVSPVVAKAEPEDAGDLNALMRLAFPDWKPEDWRVLHVPRRDSQALTTIRIQPKMVVEIDEAHRALVCIGEPSDENGNGGSAHSDQGSVGVYLFERRARRWVKTRAQDAVAWAGSDGALSDIRVVSLGTGHPALFVEGSYTGQGDTTVWLEVVEIEPAGARVVLPDLKLHEDDFGAASGDCEDWVTGARSPTAKELADEFDSQCHEVTGKWRIEPVAGALRGDIAIAYTTHRVVERARDQPRAFETAESTVVYRYSNAGYTRLSGDEPK